MIPPIKVGTALKSMRNQGFSILTAMCEVIDNSMQAGAKKVKINMRYSQESSRKKNRPIEIGIDGQ